MAIKLIMNIDKLTSQFQQDLNSAHSYALEQGNSAIETLHLLKAMLDNVDGTVTNLISICKVDINYVTKEIAKEIKLLATIANTPNEISVSQNLLSLLNLAVKLAKDIGDSFISTELYLMAIEKIGTLSSILLKSLENCQNCEP